MAFTREQPEGAGARVRAQGAAPRHGGEPNRVGRLRVARSVHDPDGFQRLVLDVTPAELAPGEYSFTVKVADPESGQARRRARPSGSTDPRRSRDRG